MLANPWNGAPTCRIYVWDSDGTFPSAKIDSIDVQLNPANIGRWTWVDVSELGLEFSEGEDFHVGFKAVNLQPGDRVDLHAGVPVDSLPMRSSLMYNGEWVLFNDFDPEGHNFDIRVVVVEEPEPVVEITTLTIPNAYLGQYYSQTVEVEGGIPSYYWDMTAGSLPDGIALENQTGVISGQATSLDTAHFTIRVTDGSTPPLTDNQHLTLVTAICDDAEDDNGSVLPEKFVLRQNYPNPFNSVCNIEYALPTNCHVTVAVYNILGQMVKVLLDEYQDAGSKLVKWDGKDERGKDVASGIYFYRLEAGEFSESKRMVMLK
jgi:hypothetical protein